MKKTLLAIGSFLLGFIMFMVSYQIGFEHGAKNSAAQMYQMAMYCAGKDTLSFGSKTFDVICVERP